MDKYEKKVRVNQIVACIKKGEYLDAQEIADTIDWRQEKSIRTLRMVSEVYKINKRYDDSLAVLNLAYEKNPEDPIKRKIVYDLCELAIKMGQFGIAVRFMKEFSRFAPKDPGRYILQYRLLKATDADYYERIELLEEFKSKHFGDFDGRWAYELAYLYHLTGKGDKCVECCNEIALWFVTGPVVIKALKLKREHEQLSYEEEQKIANADQGIDDEEVLYQKKHKTDTAPVYMDTTPVIGDGFSTGDAEDRLGAAEPDYRKDMTGQDDLAQLSQLGETDQDPQGLKIEVKKVDPSMEPTIRMAEKLTGPSIMSRETNILPKINKSLPQTENNESPVSEPEQQKLPEPVPDNETADQKTDKIPFDLDLPDEKEDIKEIKDAISQTGAIAQQEISVNLDKFSTMNLQAELRENMEKLQEETGEPLREKEEKLPDRVAEPDRELTELKAESDTRPMKAETAPKIEPAEKQTGPVSEPSRSVPDEMTEKDPMSDPFRNYISQEMDGQMQLNVPDEEPVDEKQITGQMDIQSVLEEWDKLQEEAKEKRIKAAKQRSLEQTNELSRPLAKVLPGYELRTTVEEKEEKEKGNEEQTEETGVSDISAALESKIDSSGKDEPSMDEPETDLSYEEAEVPEDTYGEETEPEEDEEPKEETVKKVPEPEPAAEPDRKKPHFVTYETVELPSVFDSFLNIKGLPPQLKEAEDRMSMEASHGNVLIIGSEHAARMELIQAIVRDMGEKESKGEIKAAAIDADTFNNKDVAKSVKALAGNVLIIEGAGRLSDDAMNALLTTLAEEKPSGEEIDILVILEDSKGGAKDLSEYNDFDKVFDVLVDIPTLSNDYLVDHAKSYAMDKGYTLDDMAVLALYQRIDERQTADHVVTSDEVEHIIDAAIKKVNKKNLKHLGDVLFGKRYNDEDMIVLREKDFVK